MLHMNEALLGRSLCPPSDCQGAPYVPRLSFKPFDVAIFGRFACRCRNFVLSHVFHTPRPRTPYPGTPALRFPPSRSRHDFTGGFAQISREKKNFRYFIWFELIKYIVLKCLLGKVNKVKTQNPTFSLHGKQYEINIQKGNSNFISCRTSTEITMLFGFWRTLSL